MKTNTPYIIDSISEEHRLLGLPKPQHPLVSVYKFEDIQYNNELFAKNFTLNFYCVAVKKNFKGKLRYGQQYYDFDEGMMSFIAPHQLLLLEQDEENVTEGYCLMFHPDFIAGYPLAKKINSFGFFSYSLYEALHLSEKEEATIDTIFANLQNEYHSAIDHFSQDIIVSQIEVLLNYSNRFYKRQFITRQSANKDILIKLEEILSGYFDTDKAKQFGLPTVQHISGIMHVSPNYLSDMLRTITGQNTQQHIQTKLIEKAKEKLSTTNLSVGEIAYELGFEHPQSFSKLFKTKTNLSPLAFRQSFN